MSFNLNVHKKADLIEKKLMKSGGTYPNIYYANKSNIHV